MKTTRRITLTITLTFLLGCDTPEPATQPQSQVQRSPSAAASPEPSTGITEKSAADILAEFTAKVVKVTDGDTIHVLTDAKETIRIRLNGIDAPELGQPFGNNARETSVHPSAGTRSAS
jgi:endonuclease YncB( thermonuclease family)